MKKQLVSTLLVLTMVCTLFAGCGKKEEAVEEPAETTTEETQDGWEIKSIT